MKTINFVLLAALLLIIGAVPVSAQTVATTTTLSANVAAGDTVISVTSATGFTAGNALYVDAEQMLIRSVSGTAITVMRGQNGTADRAHDNAERVITGAATGGFRGEGHFHIADPDYGADCTRGSGQVSHSPWINVRTGTVWMCGGSGQNGTAGLSWTATNVQPVTFNSIPTSF